MTTSKPTCMDCQAVLKMKSACICEACMRESMNAEEIEKLRNPVLDSGE